MAEKMKLCTYIVKYDRGLAPNPFWGWCTLAVCTPNHQPARLRKGDWIAGFLGKKRQNHFLYAMELCEDPISMDDYFRHPEFQVKKPNLGGDWMERCGDNFYSLKSDGQTWQQHRNRYHVGADHLKKDTKHPIVFIARNAWYFGASAKPPPPGFCPLIPSGTFPRGIRTNHEPELVKRFCDWVRTFPVGVHGLPNDNLDLDDEQFALNTPISPCSLSPHRRC